LDLSDKKVNRLLTLDLLHQKGLQAEALVAGCDGVPIAVESSGHLVSVDQDELPLFRQQLRQTLSQSFQLTLQAHRQLLQTQDQNKDHTLL
jgi:hypothetical protein